MDQLEKVEKLKERANVTYEEAKEALEASNWDLLDAMVYLEKMGKTEAPRQETYSTSYEEQSQYVSVKDKVKEKKKNDSPFVQAGKLVRLLLKKSRENFFCVSRKGEEILKIPVLLLICVLLIAWHITLIALIAGLFFDCTYSFCGKDDLETANKAMEKAGEFAEKVKDEVRENNK